MFKFGFICKKIHFFDIFSSNFHSILKKLELNTPIFIIFFSQVVSAAPSTTEEMSFFDLFSSDFTDIVGALTEHGEHFKCMRNVIGRVMGNSELKRDWTDTQTKMDKLRGEWQKCKQMEDSKQQL